MCLIAFTIILALNYSVSQLSSFRLIDFSHPTPPTLSAFSSPYSTSTVSDSIFSVSQCTFTLN